MTRHALKHRILSLLTVLALCALAASANAAGVLDEFGSSHLTLYAKTDTAPDLAQVAAARGGTVKGNYVTWTGTASSFGGAKTAHHYGVPLTFAMTDTGDFFVGAGGDRQQAISVLMPVHPYRDNTLQTSGMNLGIARAEYESLRTGGALAGLPAYDDIAPALGLHNATGSTAHSVYSMITWMHTVNGEWRNLTFREAGYYWSPTGNPLWSGTAERNFSLVPTGITESVVHCRAHCDNGESSRVYTDGTLRASISHCAESNWYSTGYVPGTVKLWGEASWSETDAQFKGVFLGDSIIATNVTCSQANNPAPQIVSYATGWTGESFAEPIPEPATMLAALAGLAGVGRYLPQRATR